MFDFIAMLGLLSGVICIVMAIVSLFKRNGKIKKCGIGILISFIILCVGAINSPSAKIDNKASTNAKPTISNNVKKDVKKDKQLGILKVHYINVGQADSILIQENGHNMLIDAGNNEDNETVKNYLVSQGVNNLEFLIGTHPHEDHIGGMDYIINSFKVGKIYMPKVTTNTKTFKDLVTAAKDKGLKFANPIQGESFKLGEATCTILAPKGNSYKGLNDHSIVLKMQFGSNSFLFTGDAEATSEMEMVNSKLDLSADVLKVGHHGSKTSTVSNFLDKVSPKYAVVSVGKDNKYNHPSQGVMSRLKSKDIKVYRTDENGTIIATSDGKNITFNCKPASYNGYASEKDNSTSNINKSNKASNNTNKNQTKVVAPQPIQSTNKVNEVHEEQNGTSVWISATGKKYHSIPNCGRMNPNNATKKTLQDAQNSGYTPCKKCY